VALVRALRQNLPPLLAAVTRLGSAEALRDELQRQVDDLQERHDALLTRQRDLEQLLGEALGKLKGELPGG
jgi:hypothetical protein